MVDMMTGIAINFFRGLNDVERREMLIEIITMMSPEEQDEILHLLKIHGIEKRKNKKNK
jgi:hypothetical protein